MSEPNTNINAGPLPAICPFTAALCDLCGSVVRPGEGQVTSDCILCDECVRKAVKSNNNEGVT